MRNGASGKREMNMARGLGWFSLGLGVIELLAARSVARATGVGRHSGLIRLMGVRELASGLAIFGQNRPAPALWSRVAGDLLDLGLLAAALTSTRKARERDKILYSLAAVAGVTALDLLAGRSVSKNPDARYPRRRVRNSITISRPVEEVYQYWRDFENLARFMEHVKSVEVSGERSRWVAKGPAGTEVKWEAVITEDRPNELISWRSLEGSDVENSGSVRFERAPGGRGTIVRVAIDYQPPAGPLGAAVAKVFMQAPGKQVPVDLRRFKQIMEVGEVVLTEGQPAGRSSSTSWKFDEPLRR